MEIRNSLCDTCKKGCKVRREGVVSSCSKYKSVCDCSIPAQEPKPKEQEWCECEKPDIYTGKDKVTGCTFCGKPIKPTPPEQCEHEWENCVCKKCKVHFLKSKPPEVELPEELKPEGARDRAFFASKELNKMWDTINQLLRYLNAQKGER